MVAPDRLEPGSNRVLAGGACLLFALLLAGTGIADLGWPRPEPPLLGAEKERLARAERTARWLDGTRARTVEATWRRRSRVRGAVGPWYTFQLFRWLNQGSSSVLAGDDGWLFVDQRITPRDESDDAIAIYTVSRLTWVQRRLARRGVRMVTVPIPRKAAVEWQRLPRGVDPRRGCEEQIVALAPQTGLDCVDLFGVFAAPAEHDVYMKWDSHWSTYGELIAAEETCRQAGTWVPEEDRVFELKKAVDTAEGRGSLRTLGIVGDHADHDFFLARKQPVYRVVDKDGNPLGRDHRRKGLDHVVCGTSFTARRSYWMFLSYYSGVQVENGARQAQPSDRVLLDFLRTRKDDLPELIYLEFPTHNLVGRRDRCLASFPRLVGLLGPGDVIALPRATAAAVGDKSFGEVPPRRTWRRVLGWTQTPVVHDGCGSVAVRLEGRGPAVEVELRSKAGPLVTLEWKPRDGPVILPLVHDGRDPEIELFVRAQRGSTGPFTLTGVTLGADVAPESRVDATAAPVEVAGNERRQAWRFGGAPIDGPSSLLVEVAEGAPRLDVALMDADGGVLSTQSVRAGATDAVVSVPYLGEARLDRVVVSWTGGEEVVVTGVSWMAIGESRAR